QFAEKELKEVFSPPFSSFPRRTTNGSWQSPNHAPPTAKKLTHCHGLRFWFDCCPMLHILRLF
ncbi:hypothetical protein ACWKSR_13020, partial [Campylobacter fetus subsp. venerealis]